MGGCFVRAERCVVAPSRLTAPAIPRLRTAPCTATHQHTGQKPSKKMPATISPMAAGTLVSSHIAAGAWATAAVCTDRHPCTLI
jgi:hypothetical protein